MLPTIIEAIDHQNLKAPEKILWLRLFIKYGYEPFSGSYEEMAEEVNSNRWTVRAQMWNLKKANAVKVNSYYYTENKTGQAGQTFYLQKPKVWKNA